eukprot:jgi/Bigna1/145404/aug1.98_g20112
MGQAGSGLSGPGVRGLKNLDSTCYMNVGLQCLFQTPGLTATLSAQVKKNNPSNMSNNSSGQRLDNAKVNDDGDNEDGSKMGVGGDIKTKKETKLITSPTSSSSRQLRHWDNTVERIPKKHRKRNEASVVRKYVNPRR